VSVRRVPRVASSYDCPRVTRWRIGIDCIQQTRNVQRPPTAELHGIVRDNLFEEELKERRTIYHEPRPSPMHLIETPFVRIENASDIRLMAGINTCEGHTYW
jgi:hypothetical protein